MPFYCAYKDSALHVAVWCENCRNLGHGYHLEYIEMALCVIGRCKWSSYVDLRGWVRRGGGSFLVFLPAAAAVGVIDRRRLSLSVCRHRRLLAAGRPSSRKPRRPRSRIRRTARNKCCMLQCSLRPLGISAFLRTALDHMRPWPKAAFAPDAADAVGCRAARHGADLVYANIP